jgi:hypothetical protein
VIIEESKSIKKEPSSEIPLSENEIEDFEPEEPSEIKETEEEIAARKAKEEAE